MKRFKTKQELEDISSLSWNNFGKMDYLFGLPVEEKWVGNWIELYPKLTKQTGADTHWIVENDIITSDPHPFDSMDIKVRVTPKQSKKLQKKAFAMGYRWWARSKPEVIHTEYEQIILRKIRKEIGANSTWQEWPSAIELTYKQFMNGTVPKKEFKIGDWVEILRQKYYTGAYEVGHICQIDEITENGKFILHDDSNTHMDGLIFRSDEIKHARKPVEQPLKFKGYKVIKNIHSYDIGCANITHDDINAFLRVCDKANGEATPNEIAEFARKHHK